MRNITRNYIFSILYQMLNIILPLITTPYVSRALGVSGVGHNSYVVSIVGYYSLFLILGTYTYGQKEIGAHQENKKEYTQLFVEIFLLKFFLGILVIIVYICTIPLYGNNLLCLFWIRILTLFANMIDISWFFQGMENFKITVTRQMFIRLAGVMGIFLFVKNENDLAIYALVDSLLALIGNISIFPYLGKYIDINSLKNNIKNIKLKPFKHLKGTLGLFFPQIATSLYMSLDKSMIGYFYEDGFQGGYYEQATKIHMLGLSLVIALTNVLIPRLALYYEQKNDYELIKCSDNALSYIFFVGAPIAMGISAIAHNFLPWFMGVDYLGAADVLHISATLILVMGLTNFIGYGYLVATCKHGIYTVSVVVGTIINIFCNIVLIPKCGAIGAASASVASEVCVLIFQMVVVSKYLPISKIFIKNLRYVGLSFFMWIVVSYLGRVLSANFYNTVLLASVGVLIYAIPLLVIKDKYSCLVLDFLVRK